MRTCYVPILLFVLSFVRFSSAAQDIHLSQFFSTPLMRNPALAGIYKGDTRLQAVYRNQWQSIGYPYQTSVLSGEYKFGVGYGNDFITAGINCFYDVAGSVRLKTLQIMPVINYHKSLSDTKNSYLSAGFMAGFVQRSFDGNNLTFDNQYNNGRFNPSAATGENFIGLRRSFFDVALGLTYNCGVGKNGNMYVGGSLWHFNKPKVNFMSEDVTLSPKWQLNAGYHSYIGDKLDVKVEANYLQQADYRETIGGIIFSYNLTDRLNEEETKITQLKIGGGILLRVNDAAIPVVQISYNHLDVNFSYDVNTSKLKTASQARGGFELGLSFRAFTSNKSSLLNSMRCPRF